MIEPSPTTVSPTTNTDSKPILMFHVQHFFGMGHLIRALALTEGLTHHFRVILVTGGELPAGIAVPPDLEVVVLPGLGMTLDSQLFSIDPELSVGETLARRRRLLLDIYDTAQPDVVLVELFPFGRKKLAEELIPLLERASADVRRPLTATSVRDILVTGRHDQARHDARAADVTERLIDLVLAHGDQRFADFFESFKPPAEFETPVLHTGFIARRPPVDSKPPEGVIPGSVVVSAGGGWVGGALMQAALDAQRSLWEDLRLPMTLITGPLADNSEFSSLMAEAAEKPGISVLRSVPDLVPALQDAAVSISQCGYNTTLDLLRTQVPAIVVPFGNERENEQPRRALRLAQCGLATALDPAATDGETLVAAVTELVGTKPANTGWAIDGAAASAKLLVAALSEKRSQAVSAVPLTAAGGGS